MKKIFLVLLVLLLSFMSVAPVSAGAPKIAYKIGEDLVTASIKAVEARKGFKVVNGTGEVVQETAETFSGALKKELQDTAVGSWDVINGSALDATPLKGMPKWLKVTVGTAAFVTSADILLDIYNYIQSSNKPVEYISKNVTADMFSSLGPVYAGIEQGIYDGVFLTVPISTVNLYVKGAKKTDSYIGSYTWNGKTVDGIMIGSNDVGLYPDYYLVWDKVNQWIKVMYLKEGLGSPSQNTYMYFQDEFGNKVTNQMIENDVPVQKMVVDPSTITQVQEVPAIDTTKETQTLIVPNPEVVPVEDMNQLINENWDMVSNPEEWLQQNPEADPDAAPVPDPVPELDPDGNLPIEDGTPANPWKNLLPNVWLLALLDLLRAIIEYLIRLFDYVLSIPFVTSKPIDNAAFAWFKNAKILGINPMQVISSFAMVGLSFSVYKIIRRIFSNG